MEFWQLREAAGWRCKLDLLNVDNAASAFCEVSGFLSSFTGCADYWEFVSRLLVLYLPAREVVADLVLTLPSQQWIMIFPADSFARSTIRKLVEASDADDAESLRAARKIARLRILLDEQPPTSVMVQSFLSATATLPPPLERSFCSQTARAAWTATRKARHFASALPPLPKPQWTLPCEPSQTDSCLRHLQSPVHQRPPLHPTKPVAATAPVHQRALIRPAPRDGLHNQNRGPHQRRQRPRRSRGRHQGCRQHRCRRSQRARLRN